MATDLQRPPLVSAITATHNMAAYVREAVDSILAQTHPNVEAIVVDDGSTDGTDAILARYAGDPRVRIVRQSNAGQTRAKNRGLQEARGEFIGFCDADDRWHPHKLERQLPHFTGRPELGVVYGDFVWIDSAGRPMPTPRWRCFSGHISGKLLADNFVHFPTALVRREAIDAAGGFDPSLTMGIDYDLWLRLSVKWEFLHLEEIFVDYRVWEGQMSHRTGERLDNAFRTMTRFLEVHPGSVTAAEARHAWAFTFVTRACWHARERRPLAAAADFWRAARREPRDLRLWRSMAQAVLGRL
ncbi:MAG: glycosyltransferase [Candidatus Eisenbacteria bacterium]